MSAAKPWLSVVTVVKDDLAGLRQSLNSLNQQDISNVELVVIDGSLQQDEVLAEVNNFPGRKRVEWCKPMGVYPAMNHALGLVEGEYIYFLNAGDTLIDPQVLSDLHNVITASKPEWFVGLVEIAETIGNKVTSAPWDFRTERAAFFSRGVFPPHQGTVVRTDMLRKIGGFNTEYTIAADYASALSLSLIAEPTMSNRVIACFSEGGLSTKKWKESFREFHQARLRILQPRGWGRIVEQWNYSRHFASVWLVRSLRRA